WTPGHIGIEGNELADARAKEAARGRSSEGEHLPKTLTTRRREPIILPQSKSALRQQFNKRIRDEAKQIMIQSPRYPLLHRIDPKAPSKHFMDIA
ncbi:hypothetical protein BV22DRAFT_994284, partial [Leucogyrophana mollusca]